MVFANADQTRRARPAYRRTGRGSLGAPGIPNPLPLIDGLLAATAKVHGLHL